MSPLPLSLPPPSRGPLCAAAVAGSCLLLAALSLGSAAASTSHAGWPPEEFKILETGPAGQHHVLRGMPTVHNYLLGGYGDDTIYGGNDGDVIWGDYHPTGAPAFQSVVIHAGDGHNFIYADDTRNTVWTGTDPETVVHAIGDGGVVHCENAAIKIITTHRTRPRYRLLGCGHVTFN
jgi:Ca2+-binding RTX toxin-like protein